MKIYFEEDLLLHYPRSGIAVYEYELMRELAKVNDVELVTGQVTARPQNWLEAGARLTPMPSSGRRRIVPMPGRWCRRQPFKALVQRWLLRDVDLIHTVNAILPVWCPPGPRPPLIATVHDVVMLRHGNQGSVARSDKEEIGEFMRSVNRADKLLTVSEFSKREMMELLNIPPEKIAVTPIAAQFDRDTVMRVREQFPEKIMPGKPFFMAVSVISPRKNYESLLKAWQKFYAGNPNFSLLIIGRQGWNCTETFHKIVNMPGVIYRETVTTAELIRYYSEAAGYLNTSRYEGFGIPLLEAMLCGCPCCYAGGSAMDEIAGATGIRVEPYDIDAIRTAMETFSGGFRDHDGAIRRQCEKFNWRDTAMKTVAAYREMVS